MMYLNVVYKIAREFFLLLIFVCFLFIPFRALYAQGSARFILAPTRGNVGTEEVVPIEVFLDPLGEEIDTVRLNLTFSQEFFSVERWTLADAFAYPSPGSFVDNDKGELSQGAFSLKGALARRVLVGTLYVRAKKAGQGELRVMTTSKAISDGEERFDASFASQVSINIQEKISQASDLSVSSSTHPEQTTWYQNNDVELSWEYVGDAQVQEYRTSLDENVESIPLKKRDSGDVSVRVDDLADGVWYFHVQALLSDGQTSGVSHFQIQIDATPPMPLSPTIQEPQLSVGEKNTLSFGTIDLASGVHYYEFSVNENDFQRAESPIVFSELSVGDYFVRVKAVDYAGNEVYGQTSFRVYPTGVFPEFTENTDQIIAGSEESADAEDSSAGGVWQSWKFWLSLILAIFIIFSILIYFKHNKK